MAISCLHPQWQLMPTSLISATFPVSSSFLQNPQTNPCKLPNAFNCCRGRRLVRNMKRAKTKAYGWLLPVDPWAPNIDSQSIASQLFAFSLFPYLGFLYFITKSKSAPKLTLFGFYFLLAFVGATIPAGIYAKVKYGTSLSNVDWLHGGAESLLTLTNLFIVLGLRQALRKAADAKGNTSNVAPGIKEKKPSI
ncbi:1-acyl-sn-glycerol-3-phosphate acyltransferase [Melia azedarach]|uniref:1-acyl-sn-glycerol-3-phosphate acyltransferase n=1 Tax=Melia azedarach TaxID=155640 RepID=A0ACC1XME7_MELAZ|nr:1-acyl-sn-glycerol-3-phosphate acyltransferase [Melia azedarach]